MLDILDSARSINQHAYRLTTCSGFYRHNGRWRRFGVITLKETAKHKMPTAHAIEREKARRYFMDAEDIRAELERYVLDPADVALDQAVRGMTGSPRGRAGRAVRVGAVRAVRGPCGSDLVYSLFGPGVTELRPVRRCIPLRLRPPRPGQQAGRCPTGRRPTGGAGSIVTSRGGNRGTGRAGGRSSALAGPNTSRP